MLLTRRQADQYMWDPELSSGKMIFLSGPRQVGKTTYVRNLLAAGKTGTYENWDNRAVRAAYVKDALFFLAKRHNEDAFLAIFDEIHKRRKWKDILKGIYDTVDRDCQIVVTGSARLDWFRKSGDSLVGRYVHFRMMPVSVAEALDRRIGELWLCREEHWLNPWQALRNQLLDSASRTPARDAYEHLMTFGGFPEPFTRASTRFLRTWKRDYLSLLITQDLRELTNIKAIETVEQLVDLLPQRVGSPLSINSLAGDLEVSHPTVKNHILQLEKLWLLFSIRPWSHRLNRTLKKERKTYFLNWLYSDGESRVFENFVATALLRATQIWTDLGFGDAELWYVRGLDGGEVDFLLTLDGKPTLLIEAKVSDTTMARPTRNFSSRLEVPVVQVVHRAGVLRDEGNALVISADRFLAALP